jgi:hypothetical protein
MKQRMTKEEVKTLVIRFTQRIRLLAILRIRGSYKKVCIQVSLRFTYLLRIALIIRTCGISYHLLLVFHAEHLKCGKEKVEIVGYRRQE